MAIPIKNTLNAFIESNGIKENLLLNFTKLNSSWDNSNGAWSIPANKKDMAFGQLINFRSPGMAPLLSGCMQRQTTLISSLKADGYEVLKAEYSTGARLAVGMGSQNVLENSLSLHHVYGVPFIPGSTLKGMTRAFAESQNNAGLLRKVFGSDDDNKNGRNDTIKGAVIFFDAMPVTFPKLEKDILTPHYSEYYSDEGGKTAPGDWMTPVPVSFLTVAEGQKFSFLIASRDKTICQTAFEWLSSALGTIGIGAKTSIGLGIFRVSGKAKITDKADEPDKVQKQTADDEKYITENSSRKYKIQQQLEARVLRSENPNIVFKLLDSRYNTEFRDKYAAGLAAGTLITVSVSEVDKKGVIVRAKFVKKIHE
ncbi:MAG: type III-B CRISPR module RAMP protein Cmr6 [Ignavibacteria bacterium]